MAASKSKRKGQALLLVTLALFAMCGLLGLAVDLGWSYYMKKSAQASADAAAMAGAYAALEEAGFNNADVCSAVGNCPLSASPCDLSGSLSRACLYAEQGGFAASDVKIATGTGAPPTRPTITNAEYWVTVRTVKTIPQLFSAVLGNPTGISSARSTAAIVTVPLNGSLITLNRATDPGANPNVGGSGGGSLNFPGGLVDSNSAPNSITTSSQINGPISALAPFADPGGHPGFPFQNLPEGPQFLDPMRGLGQPPLPLAPMQHTYAVTNSGDLNSAIFEVSGTAIISRVSPGNSSVTLQPGNYFPAIAICDPNCHHVVLDQTGRMNISGNVTFSGGSFGNYFFYGGLNVNGTMTMGPGQYVVVGGGLNASGQLDASSSGGDAGQVIVLTGASGRVTGTFPSLDNTPDVNLYPGLITQLNSNELLGKMATDTNMLGFGASSFAKSADGANNAHGLNPAAGGLPTDQNPAGADLSKFAGTVLWQDQANSAIKYTPSGQIDPACGGVLTPCATSYPTNPFINLNGLGLPAMDGLFYQPRGATLISSQTGPANNLQIVTGRFENNGGTLDLHAPTVPFKRRIVALIE